MKNETKNRLPKLLIVGSARHGKDTFAEMLRDRFGLKFISSSQAAADIFIYDELKEKYGYTSSEQCFEDRVNHRQEWYELICDYNKDNRARLAKDILNNADCYVGMRDKEEIDECMSQGLFDLIIWIDASDRHPLEDSGSFNIDISCADIVIYNNGTLEEFESKVIRIGKVLMGKEPMLKIEEINEAGGFLELLKSKMPYEDGWVEIDLYNFADEVKLHGWPEVGVGGERDILDLENHEIINLNDHGMTIICGGDWQEPHKVELRYDGISVHVVSYGPCEYDDGLSEDDILRILGLPVPN